MGHSHLPVITDFSYWLAFMTGELGSVYCLCMCGGLDLLCVSPIRYACSADYLFSAHSDLTAAAALRGAFMV
ncbi:MAG: hypothetical protein ABTQ26_08470 [Azonexus sp.]